MAENQMRSVKPVESVLKIDPVIFDELSFERKGFPKDEQDASPKLSISYEIEKLEDGKYCIRIHTKAEKKDEYVVNIKVSGYCTIGEDVPNKDEILKYNAFSIVFPYVRSELTLLTSQPEVEPLVLPVMNIRAMMETTEDKD